MNERQTLPDELDVVSLSEVSLEFFASSTDDADVLSSVSTFSVGKADQGD